MFKLTLGSMLFLAAKHFQTDKHSPFTFITESGENKSDNQ